MTSRCIAANSLAGSRRCRGIVEPAEAGDCPAERRSKIGADDGEDRRRFTAGGAHLEEGITYFLKDKNFTLAGRKGRSHRGRPRPVSPPPPKTGAVELVEQERSI